MYCNSGCGTEIHFDDDVISKNGKKIPLEGDNRPHNCPKSKWYKPKFKSNLFGYEKNEYVHCGNFILKLRDFCKCGLYTGMECNMNGIINKSQT